MARCTRVPRRRVGNWWAAIHRGNAGAERPTIIWNAGIRSNNPPTKETPGATATMASTSMVRPNDCLCRLYQPIEGEVICRCLIVKLLQDNRGRYGPSRV